MWTAIIVTNFTCIKMCFCSVFTERKIKGLQVFLSLAFTVAAAGISPCVFWSIEGKSKKLFSSSKRPDRIPNGTIGIFH
jgi:hypothetical protein